MEARWRANRFLRQVNPCLLDERKATGKEEDEESLNGWTVPAPGLPVAACLMESSQAMAEWPDMTVDVGYSCLKSVYDEPQVKLEGH